MLKLIEGFLRVQIVKHLNDNSLIMDKQHEFRSKRICLTNMLCYMDDLVNASDEGLCVDMNYLAELGKRSQNLDPLVLLRSFKPDPSTHF